MRRVGTSTTIAFAAALALASYSGIIDYEIRPYTGHELLHAGERVAPLRLADAVTGQLVTIPDGHYIFIDYISASAPQDLENVAYASLLSDRAAQRGEPHIDFDIITAEVYPGLTDMRRHGEMTVPLVLDHH